MPTMEDAQQDAWELANISPDESGLKKAQGILKKYETAVNTAGFLPKGQTARSSFNILKDLDRKIELGGDVKELLEVDGGVAVKQGLISGLMHMMTSLESKSAEMLGHKGRKVVDACPAEEMILMDALGKIPAKKSFFGFQTKEAAESKVYKEVIQAKVKLGIEKMVKASQEIKTDRSAALEGSISQYAAVACSAPTPTPSVAGRGSAQQGVG